MTKSLKKYFKKSFKSPPPPKRMYDTVRWKQLRLNTLQIRGGLCEECLKNNLTVSATDVDHIIPHRNDPQLFYDKDNLQILCAECHSKKTASETRAESNPNTYTNNNSATRKDIQVICCPPFFDYRPHLTYNTVLDEYVIAYELYKKQGKQELMIARKVKYQRAQQQDNYTLVLYEHSLNKRLNIMQSLNVSDCLVLVPELYLIDNTKQREVAQWLNRLQTRAEDTIKRIS